MTFLSSFQTPSKLEFFASLVAEDASLSLVEAAATVAQDEFPQLATHQVIDQVDSLADRLRRRIPADAAALQRLRMLNHYFFEELGFAGNINNYYDARNSYLSEVLQTRRGIPITLAILYVEMATQVGLTASGVSFPGHFLIKLQMPRGEVIVDPFTGHSVSIEELEHRLAPLRHQQSLRGEVARPLSVYLQAATAREVLARLLRNLKEIHRSARDGLRMLAVLDRLVILLPLAAEERRDRGVALAELGQLERGIDDLVAYLARRSDAPDAMQMGQLVNALRRRLGRPLH